MRLARFLSLRGLLLLIVLTFGTSVPFAGAEDGVAEDAGAIEMVMDDSAIDEDAALLAVSDCGEDLCRCDCGLLGG